MARRKKGHLEQHVGPDFLDQQVQSPCLRIPRGYSRYA